MFERRLKIFLMLLIAFTGVLLLRSIQLQVFGRNFWVQQAVEINKRPQLIETTREQCGNAPYKPFPELETLCLAKKCE